MALVHSGDIELDNLIRQWLSWDMDPLTNSEVLDLIEKKEWTILSTLMRPRISFGTSGFRSRMQAGFARMNDVVVIQLTQGLSGFLMWRYPEKKERTGGVVVGYDGRRNSKRFAELVATVLLSKDYRVLLYSQMVPTAFVPFCVKQKRCLAGIMITAAHNKKDYNGYKIWLQGGIPLLSSSESEFELAVGHFIKPEEKSWRTSILTSGKYSEQISDPFSEMLKLYCEKIKASLPLRMLEINVCSDQLFVYTALHGVGFKILSHTLKSTNLKPCVPVVTQKDPNEEFPTINSMSIETYPNALERALRLANQEGIPLVFAHNSDAGNLICAEKDGFSGSWKIFSGNELGILLGWWAFELYKENHPNSDLSQCYMLGSTVSSKFLRFMGEFEGFKYEETLIGFKWIADRAKQLESKGKVVLFAFEESYSYMMSNNVPYKDGISAALHLVSCANYIKYTENLSLVSKLKQIYEKYGYHTSKNSYFYYEEYAIVEQLFTRLRSFDKGQLNSYPRQIMNGKFRIMHVRDITIGFDTVTPDRKSVLPETPNQQMITFTFENGVIITLRTSGTENLLKFYSEFTTQTYQFEWQKIDHTLNSMVQAVIEEFIQPEKHRLSLS